MKNFLVYRDKLFVPSESFIANSYQNFHDLKPVFAGMTLRGQAAGLPNIVLQDLFRQRFFEEALFKQFGVLKSAPLNAFREIRPSLVHAHFGKSGAIALPISEELNVPLIVTFHGGDATKVTHTGSAFWKVYNRRKAKLFRKSQKIIAVSEFIRGRLLSQGAPADKVIVHHNGVDPQFFRASEKTKKLLFVGRFVAKKGIDTLVQAMIKARSSLSGWDVVLIGDGPLRPQVEAMLAEAQANVTLVGWAEPSVVRQHMSDALIVVVPSRTAESGDSEGLPMVVMEAMMSSAAVIGSRHAGIPEAVQDGQTGLLFDEGDAAQLADRLSELLNDEQKTTAFGKTGRQNAESHFNIQIQSARLEELFLSL